MRPRHKAIVVVPVLFLLAIACGDTTHSVANDAGMGAPKGAVEQDATLVPPAPGVLPDTSRYAKRTTKMRASSRRAQKEPEALVPGALRMAVLHQRQLAPGYDFAAGSSGVLTSHAGPRGGGDAVEATMGGVHLSSDTLSTEGHLGLGVQTVSVGRDGNPQSTHVLKQHAEGQELVLLREDSVEERYMAGPLGLEQTYLLGQQPLGSGPLVIEVAFDGLMPAIVPGHTDRVMLNDAQGRSRGGYRDLIVVDATRQELAAHMNVRGKHVELVVDDAGAAYPVSVDPVVWTLQQELTAGDGAALDAFGSSVAISGTLAIVGAPNHTVGGVSNEGSAYVFSQSGTTWALQQELIAGDGAAFDAFGTSVAITGAGAVTDGGPAGLTPGIVVVGSPFHTVGALSEAGASYVFVQSGTTWSLQQELSAPDGAADDGFGTSVSVSGGTAFIGSPFHKAGGHSEAGAAYVFTESGTTWSEQQELTAGDGELADLFGYSVSVSNLYAIVGAYQHDVAGTVSAGAAYVFSFESPTWVQRQELTATDKAIADFFGYSVSMSGATTLTGATAIVGAYQHNVGASVSAGAAYIYTGAAGVPTVWTEQQELTASDGAAGDNFGISVSMDANTAVAGAYQHAVGGKAGAGAAYAYTESGATWTLTQELTASDGAAGDTFGNAVATSNDLALVGAPSHTVGASSGAGAAYVFDGTLSDGANCYIGDAIVPNKTVNPVDLCQVCDIGTSTTVWSSAPASPLAPPNGTSCTFGTSGVGVCDSGTCESGCFVGGAFFSPGTVNPANACEVCTPATSTTAWSNEADGSACGASACTTAGACAAGVCTGATSTCTASDQCHGAGVCNTTTGVCSNPTLPDGSTCNDGNACTQTDACQAGVCTGTNPVMCTPADQCHSAGMCDPTSGACSNPPDPDGTMCSDGNACTQLDACQAGVCTGGNPVVCTPLDECHIAGACDMTLGSCSNPQEPDGTPCSVGTCQGGTCTPTVGSKDSGTPDSSVRDGAARDGSGPLDGGDASARTDGETQDAKRPKEGGSSDARADGESDASGHHDAAEHADAAKDASEHLDAAKDASGHHDAAEHHDASEHQDAAEHHDAAQHRDAESRDAANDAEPLVVASGGGCSCRVTDMQSRTDPHVLAFALVPLAIAVRRRRRAIAT